MAYLTSVTSHDPKLLLEKTITFRWFTLGLSGPGCSKLTKPLVNVSLKFQTLISYTGWRPVVAAYQWWPFAFCTGKYVFVASQIRQFCKRKQKESLQKRLVKFPVWEAKSKQFSQATHMPTPRHFSGTTAHQTTIIKYRNKQVQIAILMSTYH